MSGIPFPLAFFLLDCHSSATGLHVKSVTAQSLMIYMQSAVRTSLMAVTGQVDQAAKHGPEYEAMAPVVSSDCLK